MHPHDSHNIEPHGNGADRREPQPAPTANGPAPDPAADVTLAPSRRDRLVQPLRAVILANRFWLLTLGHLLLFAGAYWSAFCLRYDFDVPPHAVELFRMSLPFVLAIKLAIYYFSGHYHGWWRYVTFADLVSLMWAAGLSLIAVAALDHFLLPAQIPRTVLILDCVTSILLLGAARASWRLVREGLSQGKNRTPAFLVGADRTGAILAQQIQSHPDLTYRIRGFLDLDGNKRGSRLGGIPVLGRPDQACALARSYRVRDILVAVDSLPGRQLRELMDACRQQGIHVKVIPQVEDLLTAPHRMPLRDIEINDLLRRDPVQLDTRAIAGLLAGRVVMVTGAGGSIGSEICRQVCRFGPSTLIMVGRGENRVFHFERELRQLELDVEFIPRIADVNDRPRMEQLFGEHRPEVVFHAAAHKHVPLMEANPGEAIKNNVLGTRCLADLAHATGVRSFVLISTDKAVNPSSVMGVTKQLAERYIHTLSQESTTRFSVVRFGNVLGSAGSVVPLFQEQIRNGGPITVTDRRMTRFFMTIPEASQLVLQAAAMGQGGEIFVLEMGEPVRIVDLARDLVRLSGLSEDSIEVKFVGLRPGEKLHEELYFDEEETLATPHPKVRAAYHRPYALDDTRQAIDALAEVVHASPDAIRAKLRELVPEYGSPMPAREGPAPLSGSPISMPEQEPTR